MARKAGIYALARGVAVWLPSGASGPPSPRSSASCGWWRRTYRRSGGASSLVDGLMLGEAVQEVAHAEDVPWLELA